MKTKIFCLIVSLSFISSIFSLEKLKDLQPDLYKKIIADTQSQYNLVEEEYKLKRRELYSRISGRCGTFSDEKLNKLQEEETLTYLRIQKKAEDLGIYYLEQIEKYGFIQQDLPQKTIVILVFDQHPHPER